MRLSRQQKKAVKQVAIRLSIFVILGFFAWIGLNLDETTQASLIKAIIVALEPLLVTL